MHPILIVQVRLLAAFNDDAELVGLIGTDAVFDAAPKGRQPPYVVIARHDVLARDGDEAPGLEHRLTLNLWHGAPSRRAVLEIAERVVAVAMAAALSGDGLMVTHRAHLRTDTMIDAKTGQARAVVGLRFLSEAAG